MDTNLRAAEISALVFSSLMLTNAHASLPDEIDYRTYGQIYSESKNQSDLARSKAQEAFERLSQTILAIKDADNLIESSRESISDKRAEISGLQDRITDLEHQIKDLNSENGELQNEIQDFQDQIQRTLVEISEVEKDLVYPTQRLQEAQARLVEIERTREAIFAQRADAEGRFNANARRLENLVLRLDQLTSERAAINDRMPLRVKKIDQLKDANQKLVKRVKKLEDAKVIKDAQLQTLQDEVKPLKRALKTKTEALEAYQQQVAPLLAKEKAAKKKLGEAKTELLNNQTAISTVKTQIQTLKKKKENLPTQIQALETSLTELDAKVAQKESELTDKEAQLAQAQAGLIEASKRLRELRKQPQTPEVKEEIEKVRAEIKVFMTDRKELTAAVKTAKAQLETMKETQVSKKDQLEAKEKELADIEAEIVEKQAEKQELSAKTPSLRSQMETAQSEYDTISQEASAVNTQIADLKKEVEDVKKLVNSKDASIVILAEEIKLAAADITKSKNRIQSNIQEIRDEEEELDKDAALIISIRKEIKEKKEKIPQVERSVQIARDQLIAMDRDLELLAGEERELLERRDRVANQVNDMRAKLNSLLSRRDEQQSEIASRQDRVAQNAQQMDQNQQEISQSEQRISTNSQEINSLEQTIVQTSAHLLTLTDAKAEQEKDYEQKEASASRLESITAQSKDEYEQRDSLYRKYDAAAAKQGIEQGQDQGIAPGRMAGMDSVNEKSAFFGQLNGQLRGKLTGYLKGLFDGKEVGRVEGYEAGVNSSDDFDSGYDEGYALGLSKAKRDAIAFEYPKGIASAKEELLKDTPSKEVTMDANKQFKSVVFKESFTKTLDVEEFVLGESNFSSSIDQEIRKIQSEIAFNEKPEVAKSEPAMVYEAPVVIKVDDSELDCKSVYKGVEDFVKTCESAFTQNFKKVFLGEFKNIFFDRYADAFSAQMNTALVANSEVRFKEGYNKSYKVVFAEAKKEGAEVAYQNGFSKGDTEGYDQNIAEQNEINFKKGQDETKAFFKENAVVRADEKAGVTIDALSQDKELIQGSNFMLHVGLLNFGEQKSGQRDTKITVVEATRNISFDSTLKFLSDIPARAKAKVKDVFKVKINNNAEPGSKIALKLKVEGPNEIGEQVTEFLTFSDHVKVNPEIASSLDFDKEVKATKFSIFRTRFRTHTVKVNLKGLRNNVPGNYKVQTQILKGDEWIKLDTPEAFVSAPSQGETKSADVKYTFYKKIKKESLKFKVTVSYEDEVLKEEIIDVKIK